MKESLLLAALRGRNQDDRPPVWLMRQAGRYMPAYRALRKKYSIATMFRTPELIAQVTQLPIDLLRVDGAILYSDILILLDMLGVAWEIRENVGPVITHPLRQVSDLKQLRLRSAQESVPFVFEGIRLFRASCQTPLIGFCGAPFTVASYLIEGGSSKQLRYTREWMYNSPDTFHQLLDLLAQAAIDLLSLQVAAGAQAIQIFDSWTNWLNEQSFVEFSLRYMEKILKGIRHLQVPVIFYFQGSCLLAALAAQAAPDAISLDWQCDLAHMRKLLPSCIALQGNLDPCLLFACRPILEKAIDRLLETMKRNPAYVFNLGHGIFPDTPLDHVRFLVDRVQGRHS